MIFVMPVRALRGATTIEKNLHKDIVYETKNLLSEIVQANSISKDDIISVIFSTTRDINAAFPAVAAREMGWTDIPLMCTNEMEVPGSLEKCIRVLMHINTDKSNSQLKHIVKRHIKLKFPKYEPNRRLLLYPQKLQN
jgi:chorismate mutase